MLQDPVGVMEELEATEAVQENTQATLANTTATEASVNAGIGKMTALVCAMLIAATCFISYQNKDFATQQAAIILGGISGGVFGVAVGKRS